MSSILKLCRIIKVNQQIQTDMVINFSRIQSETLLWVHTISTDGHVGLTQEPIRMIQAV